MLTRYSIVVEEELYSKYYYKDGIYIYDSIDRVSLSCRCCGVMKLKTRT